jgi:hypothetical protein
MKLLFRGRERERERVQMENAKDLDHFIESGLIVL